MVCKLQALHCIWYLIYPELQPQALIKHVQKMNIKRMKVHHHVTLSCLAMRKDENHKKSSFILKSPKM
ncbi:CLUMA_CG019960, isoform A [Clunio marinus]|uniref:CLUMA_CG019960, isoform A n=1 Tax=Clunio marinus TaxID=568069 RepID=A0A1J1J7R6_9DIPT|nr:CLUMA_CG019960, isoform A [Clunio marinus]